MQAPGTYCGSTRTPPITSPVALACSSAVASCTEVGERPLHSVITLSQWISAEVSMKSCDAARSLLAYLKPIVPSPMTMDAQSYATLLQQDEAAVAGCT